MHSSIHPSIHSYIHSFSLPSIHPSMHQHQPATPTTDFNHKYQPPTPSTNTKHQHQPPTTTSIIFSSSIIIIAIYIISGKWRAGTEVHNTGTCHKGMVQIDQ